MLRQFWEDVLVLAARVLGSILRIWLGKLTTLVWNVNMGIDKTRWYILLVVLFKVWEIYPNLRKKFLMRCVDPSIIYNGNGLDQELQNRTWHYPFLRCHHRNPITHRNETSRKRNYFACDDSISSAGKRYVLLLMPSALKKSPLCISKNGKEWEHKSDEYNCVRAESERDSGCGLHVTPS